MKEPKSSLFVRVVFVVYMMLFFFFGTAFVLLNGAYSSQPSSELYDFVIQKYMPSDFIFNVFSLDLHDNDTVSQFTNNGVELTPIGELPTIKTITNVKTIQFDVGSSLSTNDVSYSNQATFMALVYLDKPLTVGYNHFISTVFDTTKVYSLQTNNRSSFQVYNDGLITNSMMTLVPDKWYSLAATFDGIGLRTKLYVNGYLVKEGPCYNYGAYFGLTLNGLKTKHKKILGQSDLRYNLAMAQVWNSTVLSEADMFYYAILYQNIFEIKLV